MKTDFFNFFAFEETIVFDPTTQSLSIKSFSTNEFGNKIDPTNLEPFDKQEPDMRIEFCDATASFCIIAFLEIKTGGSIIPDPQEIFSPSTKRNSLVGQSKSGRKLPISIRLKEAFYSSCISPIQFTYYGTYPFIFRD